MQDEDLIKLIWDFRGPDSKGIAEHHAIHLQEFAARNGHHYSSDFTIVDSNYALAFIIVAKKDMIAYRDALRPHRGEKVD